MTHAPVIESVSVGGLGGALAGGAKAKTVSVLEDRRMPALVAGLDVRQAFSSSMFFSWRSIFEFIVIHIFSFFSFVSWFGGEPARLVSFSINLGGARSFVCQFITGTRFSGCVGMNH